MTTVTVRFWPNPDVDVGAFFNHVRLRGQVVHNSSRPVFAWLLATALATLVAVVVYALFDPMIYDPEIGETTLGSVVGQYAFGMLVIAPTAVLLGAIPSCLLLQEIRRRALPRPLADLASGVSIALFALLLVVVAGWLSARFVRVDDLLLELETAPEVALGGLVGGITYWLLAGRPRPPYYSL